MVIINKKRIQIIISALLVGIFTFSLQIANNNQKGEKNKNQNNESVIQTTATPVSGKTVVLDAGHGVPDEGAQSSNGTTEAETNLKITLKVQNLLEQSGCNVILTRSDENAIYDLDSQTLKQKKISDIHNRVKIGNESSADIFVSIHLNKIPQQQYYGWQCFYKPNDENSITNPNNYKKTTYNGSNIASIDTDSPWGDTLKIVNFTSREEVTVTNKNNDGTLKNRFNANNGETIYYNIKTTITDDSMNSGADDTWYINYLSVRVKVPNGLVYVPDKDLGTPEVTSDPDNTYLTYKLPYTKPNMKIKDINFKATISPTLKGSSIPLTVESRVEAINVNGETDTRIMEISVTNTDPKLAKKIADKVREVANERLKVIMDGLEPVRSVD